VKPLRTALFAPGNKERVLVKALESGADAVIFDLEDSVPVSLKAEARRFVAAAIDGAAGTAGPAIFVRTNGAATGLLDDDLTAIVRPGLDAIFLPKAETASEVQHAAAALDRLEAAQELKAGSVEIVLMIESALGVYRCFDLLQVSARVATT
jgi:citrate lyase subunit beta / citryl-CoA lyase